jgi:probable rRNA maturation factor
VVVTDDPQIEILNMNYLKRKGPTNVIAFPMREGDFSGISPNLLGDVVISVETAEREAFEADISFERHFSQLLVHGILHLLGFDHEKDERSAAEMESKSLELVNMLES